MGDKKTEIEIIQLKEEIRLLKARVTELETGLNDSSHYVTNVSGTTFYLLTIVNGKITAIT